MFELLNIFYVGNGVFVFLVGMDKVVMKYLFVQVGFVQVKYVVFFKKDWICFLEESCEQVEQELGYFCFVKLVNLGLSVGISKC